MGITFFFLTKIIKHVGIDEASESEEDSEEEKQNEEEAKEEEEEEEGKKTPVQMEKKKKKGGNPARIFLQGFCKRHKYWQMLSDIVLFVL